MLLETLALQAQARQVPGHRAFIFLGDFTAKHKSAKCASTCRQYTDRILASSSGILELLKVDML